ncbi:MAG TPA: HAD family phosphatase [Sphingomonas sp.]
MIGRATISPLTDLLARKRLLIFDLDGTLVNSSPLHARAFADVFAPLSVVVDYQRIAGMTTGAAVDQLAGEAGIALTPEMRAALVADKQARARLLIDAELEPIAGAAEFVRRAHGRWRLALCTSASRANADAALRRTRLDGFDPIVTAEDVTRGKPDAEPYRTVLARTGVAASDALVFEDAPSGLASAAAARIDAVEITGDLASDAGGWRANWSMLNDALGPLA